MISKFPAVCGRLRHFWIEGVAGAGLTLALVSAAYAALPIQPRLTVAKPVVAQVQAPEPPAEPPAVFECGEPLPGREIDSPFGLRRLPWERHGRLHEGVDIAAPAGQAVLAVADGIVTRAGESPSYGRYVEVEHGAGLTSFYAHLGRIDRKARAGEFVERGQSVGKIGSSGTSTGPHVHFEIRQDGKPLNPVSFLDHDFKTVADLPLKAAAYVSPRVRVAQVSSIPESKQALMAEVQAPRGKGHRVRARLKFETPVAATPETPVLIADTAD